MQPQYTYLLHAEARRNLSNGEDNAHVHVTEDPDKARNVQGSSGNQNKTFLMLSLILATALGPSSMTSFVVAVPFIQNEFGITATNAQYTISIGLLGMAVATLLYGPLSDRYGRRPVMLAGIGVAAFGCMLGAVANSIEMLIAARLLQSAGAISGMVISRVVVYEFFGRAKATAMLGALTAGMIVPPLFAATVGGVLVDTFGWRSIFVVFGGLTMLVWGLVFLNLRETNLTKTAHIKIQGVLRDYYTLLNNRHFVICLTFITAAYSAFICFMAGAPFVAMRTFGLSASVYGLVFTLVPAGYFLGSLFTARFGNSFGNVRLIVSGATFSFCIYTLGAVVLVAGIAPAPTFFIAMGFLAIGNGLSMPGGHSESVETSGRQAGSGAGLIGFAQTAFSAIAAQFVGAAQGPQLSPLPTVATVLVLSAVALIAAIAIAQNRARLDVKHPVAF